MITVTSHKYVKYNANSTGRNTGDCVVRSLSLAYNMSYSDTHKELTQLAGHGRPYNVESVYTQFISNHGLQLTVSQRDKVTLAEFCDSYGQSGTYLVITSDSYGGRGDHIVCVIDGTVYDSWDSSKCYVVRYFVVNESPSVRKYDSSEKYIANLSVYAKEVATELSEKYLEYFKDYKPDLDIEEMYDSSVVRLRCFLHTVVFDKNVKFSFKIDISIPLDMSEDDAKTLVQKTLKIRLYDRFSAIRPKFENKVEEIETEQEYSKSDYLFLDGREARFVNTLPGWIKPLLTYVNITSDYWGELRYSLRCKPLKGDPVQNTPVDFDGYTASQIREEVRRYKENYSRVYTDYAFEDVADY